MADDHLAATIRWMERKAREGVTVRSGGGTCAEDMFYDEEVLFGADALERLEYAAYVQERTRRAAGARFAEL
jgi:hypothetical protein